MINEIYENLIDEGLKDVLKTAALTTALGTSALVGTKHLSSDMSKTVTRDVVQHKVVADDTLTRPKEIASQSVSQSVIREFGAELDTIIKSAKRNGIEPNTEDFAILLAIRKAENGKAGREFGVLHPRAIDTDLDTQAGWCAATIMKNRERWKQAGKKEPFIQFLGKRYCPVGAENDPSGLNKHWIRNVTSLAKRFVE